MKLFKSLLVAPATLGLLAPMSVTANEINFSDVSGYSSSSEVESITDFNPAKEIAITNSRVDGLEARLNNFEAGSFSETTTASFSADFAIGAVEGKGVSTSITDGDEALQAVYGFQIDLNTSFTGEDSLDISLDAGNGLGTGALGEFDLNGKFNDTDADAVNVDGVSYTFPVGDKMTVMVGDNIDGSALFTTACVYGGPSNTMDDCGNVNANIENGGAMVGTAIDLGRGFTTAFGWAADEAGIGTKEKVDAYGANLAYTADNYGVSLTYGVLERLQTEDTYTALNAYYTPDGLPSISAGYEIGALGDKAHTADETLAWFVGIGSDIGPGTFGAAFGTAGSMTEAGTGSDKSTITELMMYEAYYEYPVNDGMTVTPLVYVKEIGGTSEDETGVMVKTSFSF